MTGIAGIGKSRLAWEFYKYFDGLSQTVYWHRGRCLSYGEGVTYWALADMVRMRCRIAEDDPAEAAGEKLRSALDEHVLDAEERRFVEPRLAQLLGLGEQESRDRQDLFAAWRLFFERLAETYPTVLVFEDMQWADASMLDFVEYLLEWSRDKPLLVVTLARPDLLERRPTWGAGHRNFTSLYLEPLPEQAMQELLVGLVPGLPPSLRSQILARAEGVPLYAVETVRMLLDRGLVVEDGTAYKVVGEVETLEVPETLHALVAARLDGLSPEERRLVQDAAVLGKTFTPSSLAALTGQPQDAARATARGSRAQRAARGAGGSALARARPVRVPPGHHPTGRVRDAAEARASRSSTSRPPSTSPHSRRGRGRRGRRLASARGLSPRSRRSRRRGPARRTRTPPCFAPANEPLRSAPPSEAQRYFEQAGRARRRAARGRPHALTRAGEMSTQAGDAAERTSRCSGEPSLCTRGSATRTPPAVRRPGSAFAEQLRGDVDGAIERMERAIRDRRTRRT